MSARVELAHVPQVTAEERARPKAVLFDWDNTLVDSWAVIHDALNTTFEAFGHIPWTLAETRVRVRKSMRDSFPALFGDAWERAGEIFYRRYAEIHVAKLKPLPGAAAMLSELHEAGVYLGVVSNKKGEFLHREAAHLGWQGYFGRLVGALDAARDKPAIEPVALALAGSGITAGPEVWLVGDAGIDLECAATSGCLPVLLRAETPQADEFPGHAPALYFRECQALRDVIQRLPQTA